MRLPLFLFLLPLVVNVKSVVLLQNSNGIGKSFAEELNSRRAIQTNHGLPKHLPDPIKVKDIETTKPEEINEPIVPTESPVAKPIYRSQYSRPFPPPRPVPPPVFVRPIPASVTTETPVGITESTVSSIPSTILAWESLAPKSESSGNHESLTPYNYPLYYENPDLKDYVCPEDYNYYAVINKCDHFVECKKQTALEFICPDGLYFNPEAKWPEYQCIERAKVVCKIEEREAEILTDYKCLEENNYYPFDNHCDGFIECRKFHAMKFMCPDGLQFSKEIKWPLYPCVEPLKARCGIEIDPVPLPTEKTTSAPLTTPGYEPKVDPVVTTLAPVVTEKPDFVDYKCLQENAYESIADNCYSFIECKGYTPMKFTCPDGLHFNATVLWPAYPCGSTSIVRCGEKLPEPIPQPVPKPDPRPVPWPRPVPVPQPQPTPEPIPVPEPVPQPQPQPNPRPVPWPRPVPQPQPTPEPIPVPQPQPQPNPRPVPWPRPVPQPQPTPEPIPEPQPQPQPNPKPVPWPRPVPQPQPTPEPIPEPQPQPQPNPKPVPWPRPVPQPQPTPEPIPEPQPQPQPNPKPVPWPRPVPQPQPTPKPIPVPEPKPVPDPKRPIPWPKPIPTLTTPRSPFTRPIPTRQPPTIAPRPTIAPTSWPVPEPTTWSPRIDPLDDFACPDANNYYSLPGDCSAFVECKSYVPIKYTCTDGLHFDRLTTWPEYPCGDPAYVRCGMLPEPTRIPPIPTLTPTLAPPTRNPLVPTTKPSTYRPPIVTKRPTSTASPPVIADYVCDEENQYYSMNLDCESYVDCKKYVPYAERCPDGLQFNSKIKWPEYPCSFPSEVKCGGDHIKEKVDPNRGCPRQYGYYALLDGDCSRYLMCQEGQAYIMDCPAGLVFNDAESSCDWPENVPSCRPSVFQGFTCPAAGLDEDGQPDDRITKYRYGQSCREYVACQRGHPRLLSCDAGLSFDDESESCIDFEYVTNCTN